MCHHTREPTVLSRVSCRPFHLNFDRFHQPCLSPGRTSRIGGACRFPVPRGDHLPLWAAQFFLLCVLLEVFATPTRQYHDRTLISSFLSCMCHSKTKGVCTHASSGPSKVRRRRLLVTCLGDPIPLAINRFCCETLSTRSLYFCNKSSSVRTSVEGVGVVINKLAGSDNGQIVLQHGSPRSCLTGPVFITRI